MAEPKPTDDEIDRARTFAASYVAMPYPESSKNAARVLIFALDRLAQLEKQRESTVRALQTIVRNDTTAYEHHQPRRWDGKTPDEDGGTIWLTPREMARQMLSILGAEVPDAFVEMRALVAARKAAADGA